MVLNIGTKKPRLDSLSPHQWSAANVRIMYQLIMDGTLHMNNIPDYLAYTVKVSQLAECYEWVSVLAYDREYRRLQAALDYTFGTDNPHLYTVYLQRKPLPSSRGSTSRGNPNPRPSATAKPGSTATHIQPIDPSSGKEVCRNFNRGHCTWGTRCHREHVCSVCFRAEHTQSEHPKNL